MSSFVSDYLTAMVYLRTGLVLVLLTAPAVSAQVKPILLDSPDHGSLDDRMLRAIYEIDDAAFSATMRGVNVASYPVFFAIVPAAGIADVIADGDFDAGARMTISEIVTAGAVFGLKRVIRRDRPYATLGDIERRPVASSNPFGGIDPFSFPSGHSAIAFAVSTSLSLSYPEWYVVVPAITWASATALARVWHGVHYPSDVVAGAVLGASVGIIVHVFLAPDEQPINGASLLNARPAVSFRISF